MEGVIAPNSQVPAVLQGSVWCSAECPGRRHSVPGRSWGRGQLRLGVVSGPGGVGECILVLTLSVLQKI